MWQTLKQLFAELDEPIAVLAGLVAIGGAIAATQARLRSWWKRKHPTGADAASGALEEGARLMAQYHDSYRHSAITDKQRLRLLRRARGCFRNAGDAVAEGNALLHLAKLHQATLSRVRDDAQAIREAKAATELFVRGGQPGWAAESEKVAGWLHLSLRRLRNESRAREHFAAAAYYYRLAGFDDEARTLEASIEKIIEVSLVPEVE